MIDKLHQLKFASEATVLGLWAGGFTLLALVAWWGDWRRHRRKQLDKVGWVPWTAVFFACLLMAAGLLVLAIKGWADS